MSEAELLYENKKLSELVQLYMTRDLKKNALISSTRRLLEVGIKHHPKNNWIRAALEGLTREEA